MLFLSLLKRFFKSIKTAQLQ
ncbi:hypothetical protein EMIT0P228_10430 [Pseudomonas brassicacearum]